MSKRRTNEHYKLYEISMKEQGTKGGKGAKRIRIDFKERREGATEEYRISLAFMPNAGD